MKTISNIQQGISKYLTDDKYNNGKEYFKHNMNNLRIAFEDSSETEFLWILVILYWILDIQSICFTLTSQLKLYANEL